MVGSIFWGHPVMADYCFRVIQVAQSCAHVAIKKSSPELCPTDTDVRKKDTQACTPVFPPTFLGSPSASIPRGWTAMQNPKVPIPKGHMKVISNKMVN